jgi:hypothetical protein
MNLQHADKDRQPYHHDIDPWVDRQASNDLVARQFGFKPVGYGSDGSCYISGEEVTREEAIRQERINTTARRVARSLGVRP